MTPPPSAPDPDLADSRTRAASGGARDLSGMTLGDYRVESLLGRGGMGEVYLARQLSLSRPVALKVLRPDLLDNPTSLSRFEAEARAAARLSHPNIVHVYAFGQIAGVRYLAMEYVRGTNLREYLARKTRLELPMALSIMKQAGLAVEAAAEVGLIHRDLKPENLLLTKKGIVKVADFGLCRDLDGARVHLTQSGMTLGTPLYMSPEQAHGREIDPRSDLYSLGVTFYHMLAGEPPFRADNALALAMKHIHEAPVSLAVHRPDLPQGVVDLVMTLLAKSPADRFPDATEMLKALGRARGSIPGGATPSKGDGDGLPSFSIADGSSRALPAPTSLGSVGSAISIRPGPEPRRRTPALLAGVMALGLIVGVGAARFWRGENLLSSTAPAPQGPPGLWIDPSWATRVPPREDAESQYRLAQLLTSDERREAAWLAVPGRFPGDRTWCSRAYIQLGRHLLRIGDREALDGLATDLARSGRENDEDLAQVLRAAVSALDGDAHSVLERLDHAPAAIRANPPALAELAREVTLAAMGTPPRPTASGVDLGPLLLKFNRALKFDPRDAEPGARPG